MTSTNDFPTTGVELRYLLVASDYARSLAFYCDVLGAKVVRQISDGLFGLERAADQWSRGIIHDGVASLVRGVSSINNNALSALASANPAAISITTRKPVTNDSAIACCSAACAAGMSPAGRVMPTSLLCWAIMMRRASDGSESLARCLSRLLLDTAR